MADAAWASFLGGGAAEPPRQRRGGGSAENGDKIKELLSILVKLCLQTKQEVRMLMAVVFICFRVATDSTAAQGVRKAYKIHADRTKGKSGHDEGGPDPWAFIVLLIEASTSEHIEEGDLAKIRTFLAAHPPPSDPRGGPASDELQEAVKLFIRVHPKYVELENIVIKHFRGMKCKQYFGQAPRGALERRAQDLFKDLNLDLGEGGAAGGPAAGARAVPREASAGARAARAEGAARRRPAMRAPGRDGAGRSQREHQIEGHLQEKIRTRYPTLRSAFRAIDRSNNGYISEADFAEALRRVFLPTLALADADVAAVARRFDLNGDGFVSFHEFATRMEGRDCEGAARAEPHREASELNSQADMAMQALRQSLDMKFATQREAFLSLPKDAKSALDEASVRDALRSRSIDLPPAQLEQVWRRLGGGEAAKTVSYRDFWRKMSNGSRFAGHLDRQMFRDPEDALAEEPRAAGAASPEAEAPRALEGAALEGLLGDLWADLRAAFDR
ncbi:unnamed protein product, partial [Prorocentrum cordatum]